jgi:galactokinase
MPNSQTSLIDRALTHHAQFYGTRPSAAAIAPGRVEIMGNHTDYNGGFVLPAALDLATVVAGEPLEDGAIELYAADLDRSVKTSVADLAVDPRNSWSAYLLGVVGQLRRGGVPVGGFRATVHSSVPNGAGLSSSAALEVSTALFLGQLYAYETEKMALAKLCQRAENEFVGVNCGILDQFSSIFGEDNALLFLDCMTLDNAVVTMGRSDIAFAICDSKTKHSHAGGDYNTRRAECMAAAAHFGKQLLREVSWDEFIAREQELPENQRKRARHILTENRRVLEMRKAVTTGDAARMGELLAEGHRSCRDLFENSAPDLDTLVEIADGTPGCIGAKLTGGGWGGCAICLVYADAVEEFQRRVDAEYERRTGHQGAVYISRAYEGAHSLRI